MYKLPKFCLTVVTLIFLAMPAAAQGQGRLALFLFNGEKETPLKDVAVTFPDGSQAQTDDKGKVVWRVDAGTYTVQLHLQTPTIPLEVTIQSASITEIIYTHFPSGAEAETLIESKPLEEETVEVEREDLGPVIPVRGKVLSEDDNAPIPGVQIWVQDFPDKTITNEEGVFEAFLPSGKINISFIHKQYALLIKKDFEIDNGNANDLLFKMTPKGLQLADFTVKAPHVAGGVAALIDQKRKASGVTEVLGAEEMKQNGDSNAAAALQRVTGLTVVGGRYVFVRGLGDRYITTLLNGLQLPSPEPERRVIPLDIFPAGVLEQMTIAKTLTPDLPGAFGGGTILLKTKTVPEQDYLKIGTGISYLTGSTFEDGWSYDGGALDLLGFDDGNRALPQEVQEATEQGPVLRGGGRFSDTGFSDEELAKMGQSFNNNWEQTPHTVLPNMKLNLSAGKKFKTNGVKWGVLTGWNYRVQDSVIERTTRTYETGVTDLQLRSSANLIRSQQRISLAGLVSLGAEFDKQNSVQAITLLTRISDKTADVVNSFFNITDSPFSDFYTRRLDWVERMLISQQFVGEHPLFNIPDWKLNWRYGLSFASREQPDRRTVDYGQDPDGTEYRLRGETGDNERFFSDLFDQAHHAAIDTQSKELAPDSTGIQFKTGLNYFFKDRLVDSRRFNLAPPVFTDEWPEFDTLVYQNPGDIFVPENINSDRFSFIETSKDTDSYKAYQHIGAAYLSNDWRFAPRWTLTSGLRFESSYQNVQAFKPGVPDNIKAEADLLKNDFLPSALLSWRFTQNMQLRLAGSSSVSRPNFRELSNTGFFDVERGRLIRGNSELESSQIHHADMRWEWYFSPKESLSLAAFGKYFNKPIEMVYKMSAENAITYQNANYAENAGVEIEARKSFDFIHKVLAPLFISGNASWIYSRVYLEEGASLSSSTERPLQGQSPWVINGRLAWTEKARSISMLYNVFGPRIVEVGDNGVPDLYEQPFHRLDFVYRENMGPVSLALKGQNLLDSTQQVTIGDKVVLDVRPGSQITLDMSFSF
ncbi:MAG: hypothetical protein CMH56_04885 [Myxococcales bacterium]|nr:hypothetical protein [Myxococcales bacterium]|tara:strand:+ start:56 stop:3175 length:3120 start_codon:yes stop_codon:yes gene_type:complete